MIKTLKLEKSIVKCIVSKEEWLDDIKTHDYKKIFNIESVPTLAIFNGPKIVKLS